MLTTSQKMKVDRIASMTSAVGVRELIAPYKMRHTCQPTIESVLGNKAALTTATPAANEARHNGHMTATTALASVPRPRHR